MSDTLINLETGEIKWDEIKKMYDNDINETVKLLVCKKCGSKFYNKNYFGNYPLCKKHMENFKN
jgi:rubrerythrin